MPRKRRSRVYWRRGRAYLDARDYAAVGGRREPLVPEGEKYATTDVDVAQRLATQRLEELERLRRASSRMALARFADHHLRRKARAEKVGEAYLEETERYLQRAVEFFGSDRHIHTIDVADMEDYRAALAAEPNGYGGTLAPQTVRHHLNALSNLYRRAIAEKLVTVGYNPVAGMMEKPGVSRKEARWYEPHEAALILEAARLVSPAKVELPIYPLIATLLLSGMRKAEALGLAVKDVAFDRGIFIVRPHPWRRLKTERSARTIPIWPQARETLEPYAEALDSERTASDPDRDPDGTAERLFFPSPRTGETIVYLDKALDKVGGLAGLGAGAVRTRPMRHSYTAARLQTLDRGEPVPVYTVARELGHASTATTERIYSHLGTVRHRAEEVSFRVEDHEEVLRERLEALRTRAKEQ